MKLLIEFTDNVYQKIYSITKSSVEDVVRDLETIEGLALNAVATRAETYYYFSPEYHIIVGERMGWWVQVFRAGPIALGILKRNGFEV